MAKSKSKPSAFNEMLTLIRRILVLSVAAFGLAGGWPYAIVLIRAAALWGVLYISSIGIELVLQYLSFRASSNRSETKEAASSRVTTGAKPAA